MKRILLLAAFALSLNFLSADELMENLKSASDQVAEDLSLLLNEDTLFSGAISFENRPVILGDLFSDLLANRLLDNSRFKGNIVKGYSPGSFRISDAEMLFSGSLYQTGTNYFLSLYLNDFEGRQKKGWEFLIPAEGMESLLESSQMAIAIGGDIYEPNDSVSSAYGLTPDPSIELENLRIGEPGDEDWFYIDIDQLGNDSTIFLLTAFTTGGLDTYMELYSPDNTSYSIVENDDGDDSNAKINFALNATGRWFLKVRAYSSDETGDYGLFTSLDMREAGPGEPDNSVEEATVLELGNAEISRTIDYGDDYDYYKITTDEPMSENQVLVVQTYSHLDLKMTLLDSYENEILSNDDSGLDSNPQIMIPSQEAGVWYAVVYPYAEEDTGSYTIKIYVMDIVKDDYESDDTMEDASEIEIDGEAQERTFMPSTDEDWVQFIVEESGDYIIKTEGSIDTYLSLYDSNGELVLEDDDSGEDNNAFIGESLSEGTYYILVSQYNRDGNTDESYRLSVSKD